MLLRFFILTHATTTGLNGAITNQNIYRALRGQLMRRDTINHDSTLAPESIDSLCGSQCVVGTGISAPALQRRLLFDERPRGVMLRTT
jgi:hypothetical protein